MIVVIVAIGYNANSYIFKTFTLAYLKQFQDVSANTTSGSVMVGAAIAIIVDPFFGAMCDRFGSRNVIMTGGAFSAIYAFIFLKLLECGTDLNAYIALAIGTGILASMAQGSFLSRQFPPEARSTGVGAARELGTAIAGGLAPLGALSLVVASPTNSTTGVGLVLVASGLLVLIAPIFDQGKRYTTSKN